MLDDLCPLPNILMVFFLQNISPSESHHLPRKLPQGSAAGGGGERKCRDTLLRTGKNLQRCRDICTRDAQAGAGSQGGTSIPLQSSRCCTSSCLGSLGWEGWEGGKCLRRLQDQMGCLSTNHYNFVCEASFYFLKINTNTVKDE